MKRDLLRLSRLLCRLQGGLGEMQAACAARSSRFSTRAQDSRLHSSQAAQQQAAQLAWPQVLWGREVSLSPGAIALLLAGSAVLGSQAERYWGHLQQLPQPPSFASLAQLRHTAEGRQHQQAGCRLRHAAGLWSRVKPAADQRCGALCA